MSEAGSELDKAMTSVNDAISAKQKADAAAAAANASRSQSSPSGSSRSGSGYSGRNGSNSTGSNRNWGGNSGPKRNSGDTKKKATVPNYTDSRGNKARELDCDANGVCSWSGYF